MFVDVCWPSPWWIPSWAWSWLHGPAGGISNSLSTEKPVIWCDLMWSEVMLNDEKIGTQSSVENHLVNQNDHRSPGLASEESTLASARANADREQKDLIFSAFGDRPRRMMRLYNIFTYRNGRCRFARRFAPCFAQCSAGVPHLRDTSRNANEWIRRWAQFPRLRVEHHELQSWLL